MSQFLSPFIFPSSVYIPTHCTFYQSPMGFHPFYSKGMACIVVVIHMVVFLLTVLPIDTLCMTYEHVISHILFILCYVLYKRLYLLVYFMVLTVLKCHTVAVSSTHTYIYIYIWVNSHQHVKSLHVKYVFLSLIIENVLRVLYMNLNSFWIYVFQLASARVLQSVTLHVNVY